MKTLLFPSYLLTSYISFFKLKNLLLVSLLLVNLVSFSQKTHIPDANFRRALEGIYSITADTSGYVLTANISSITSLNISGRLISNLTGIKDFTNLTSLNCNNNQLTALDVSTNTLLTFLNCRRNRLTETTVILLFLKIKTSKGSFIKKVIRN